MTFTITLTVMQIYAVCYCSFIALLLYLYTKIDGDDRLTQVRHDIEMKKEWFKMLAEQRVKKTL